MTIEPENNPPPAARVDECRIVENLVRMGGVTVADLERLTRLNFRTIKRRLEKAVPVAVHDKSQYFALADALPKLFPGESSGDKLDLSQERAKLAREQTLKTSIENRRLLGELAPVKEVERAMAERVTAARARFLAMPSRIAPQLEGLPAIEIEDRIMTLVEEALNELSGPGPARDHGSGVSENGATDPSDD